MEQEEEARGRWAHSNVDRLGKEESGKQRKVKECCLVGWPYRGSGRTCVCKVRRGEPWGRAYRRRGQYCRHLGHLQVPAQSDEADLLIGCHTSGVLFWAS